MESERYSLNAEDLKKIAMAMVYSGTAAALSVLAASLEQVDMPTMYLALVPIINAMLYTAVKFLQGKASV